jgi:hypothetical protein
LCPSRSARCTGTGALVNGVEVARQSWWDYEQAGHLHPLVVCGSVSDGDQATLRVEPEHMTGDWRVRIQLGG